MLKDSYRTEHVTLEDALSHRTGMPRHDFSYGGVDEEGKTYGLKDLIRGLRHLELAGGFRERFMYCNSKFLKWIGVFERGREGGDGMKLYGLLTIL